MANVYLSAQFPDKAQQMLTEAGLTVNSYDGKGLVDRKTLAKNLETADYLITSLSTMVDADLIQAAPKLKLIANYGAGFNNIDVQAAKQRRIPVTNTPVVSTVSTAELTVALILSTLRRVAEGDRLMRTTGFSGWAPRFFLGHELNQKTAGIIGMGGIGQAVATRLNAFGMHIIYTQRHPLANDQELALNATYVTMPELLSQSDVVTIHAPLTDNTHHLIDATAISQMKPSAVLINAARGPIIDETALLKALQQHKIAGAALDVYENEPKVAEGYKALDNVTLTPHIGNATVEARDAMATIVAKNVIAVEHGERPKHIVNA